MKKIKHCDGFLGCRTTQHIEDGIKKICASNNREVSEALNYLCRIFIEDEHGIRTRFLNNGTSLAPEIIE